MCCAVFVISCIKVLDTPDLRFYCIFVPRVLYHDVITQV